jgi:hypothetical protein
METEFTNVEGQIIATWRLKARNSEEPICEKHSTQWENNGETLRCVVCGLDCT